MFERMLNKQIKPTMKEMADYCGEESECFLKINSWLSKAFSTEQKIVFPYGNKYGWGVGHYKNHKLICNIFAEAGAYTVMLRLSNKQFSFIYDKLNNYSQEVIDNKYPCGDGGWIHYRVVTQEQFEDIQKLLEIKCA